MNDLTKLTLKDTLKGLAEKNFSEEELNIAYFDRIEEVNSKLNIFLNYKKNSKGIPAAIKDIIVTQNIPTTAGSKILQDFLSPYDATVIRKLKERNVSVIGKTNLDEFAMGSSGENSAYGVTRNPWDVTKIPGGSSSGSAAAVAASCCVFSLGTDTGGSIREPASLCGVVGLKPSYGRVSRYGSIALASSLDQIGPFTKCVDDARLVLDWISGDDGFDANCINSKFELANYKKIESVKGLKIGVPKEYFSEGLDKEVKEVIHKSIGLFEKLGAEIIEVSLPHTEYAIAVYYVVLCSEVSSNLARFDGIRFGHLRDKFGEEAKRRIMLGSFALSSGYFDDYFIKASKVRTLIKQDFEKVFQDCDVVMGPVSPTVAWNLGEKVSDPLKMYLSDVYTVPASLAGIPGVSIPCGFVGNLPVGLQILGPFMREDLILDIAKIYENNTEWHLRKAEI